MSSGIPTPTKNPELNRVQEESDTALKALDEVVNQLTARLLKVMSQPNLSANTEPAQDPKYYSKLAQDIDSHNNGIWSVVNSIKSVIDRLEI